MSSTTSAHDSARRAVQELGERATELSLSLHANPETPLQEEFASATLKKWLAEEGFEVESPVAGMDTAFVGRAGAGGRPHVAYLLEYDALPKLGHGCGHNLIAAGVLTAATAVRRAMPDLAGTLLVIGTPGEEGAGGKIKELDAGVFDDVDAALMFHPGSVTWPWRHANAVAHLTVKFHGKAVHAAGSPKAGRNALAAMLQFFGAVDALRQHVPEAARLHGIISNGGAAPNIVPDYTEALYMVRDVTMERVQELTKRVVACAEGAAIATGTRVEIEHDSGVYAERKNNRTLAGRVADYLRATGEEVEEPELKGGTGSSDIGNVSLVLPTIHPYMKIAPAGTPGHSEEFREAAASAQAQEAMLRMAEALALTGVDLMQDPSFVAAAWEEFKTSEPDVVE